MDERRSNRRQRTLKGATIVFDEGKFTFSCIVRNLSADGANLQVESPVGIPNEFTLMFEDQSPARRCKVAWRAATRMGVHFEPDG